MLRQYLRKYFANIFYPVKNFDWYENKGYIGSNHQEKFENFVTSQNREGAVLHNEFKFINARQQFIPTGDNCKLDSVIISPKESEIGERTVADTYIIFFQGRGEYYESRFRDKATQARETGAHIVGFNPKGYGLSSGKTQKISDIVDDGIAVVKFLLGEYSLNPKQIVFQGNSLGAAVQEAVDQYFRKNYGFRFRQINGNSYQTLSSVIAYNYRVPFLKNFIESVLKYACWEITPSEDFYSTNQYKCVLRRQGDRTVPTKAEFYATIDILRDEGNCPTGYRVVNRYLYDHSQIICNNEDGIDPHVKSLNKFFIIDKNGNRWSVYYLINLYLTESAKYI